jgi:hypothetical protein
MIAIGTFALIAAVKQHHRRVEALRGFGFVPQRNLAL